MLFPLWERRELCRFPHVLKATCVMLCFFVFSVFIFHNVFLSVGLLMLLKKKGHCSENFDNLHLQRFIVSASPGGKPVGNQVFWQWHDLMCPCWCCT